MEKERKKKEREQKYRERGDTEVKKKEGKQI